METSNTKTIKQLNEWHDFFNLRKNWWRLLPLIGFISSGIKAVKMIKDPALTSIDVRNNFEKLEKQNFKRVNIFIIPWIILSICVFNTHFFYYKKTMRKSGAQV